MQQPALCWFKHGPFEEFRDIFGTIVTSVGTSWSMSRIDLSSALAKAMIENAKASREEDKKDSLSLVEDSIRHAELNIFVNSSTKKSIIGVLKDSKRRNSCALEDQETHLQIYYAHLCLLTIGNVLRTLDDFNNALKMLNKCLAIREKVFGKEHPYY